MVATKFLVAAVSALALGVQAAPLEERAEVVEAFQNNSPLNNYYNYDANSGVVSSKHGEGEITKEGPQNLISSDDNNPLVSGNKKRGAEDPAFDPREAQADPAYDPSAKRSVQEDKRWWLGGLSHYYGYNVYNWSYGRYLYAPYRWVGNYYGFWNWGYFGRYYRGFYPGY
ncbi:hypothetical protein Q8F55_006094 [Vanrija albida]|uniref:Mating factor alpha n=1 Tax=Vanrija albida TaxID=181172 RepID=A0ABR3Q481_9TREE